MKMRNMSSDAISEKRLLAAVVAQAVRDACLPPIDKRADTGRKAETSLRADAATAMAFLFDKSVAGVEAYATWLDFDADRFRGRLLDACSIDRRDPMFSDEQRRAFRANYRLFMSLPYEKRANVHEYEDEE